MRALRAATVLPLGIPSVFPEDKPAPADGAPATAKPANGTGGGEPAAIAPQLTALTYAGGSPHCGFTVADPDLKPLACARFAKGLAFATSVAVGDGGVCVGTPAARWSLTCRSH